MAWSEYCNLCCILNAKQDQTIKSIQTIAISSIVSSQIEYNNSEQIMKNIFSFVEFIV